MDQGFYRDKVTCVMCRASPHVCRVQQAHHLRPQHREERDARAADFGGFIAVGCACRSCSAVPGMLRAPSARPGRT